MGFEVAYDPGENIKIVQTVEKYPVIYDTNKYPPVEFKIELDMAWTAVAAELGVSEGYCKGRWTNIKGCFKRYLRNKAQTRSTKTYYLANYLNFMLPFMNINRIRQGGQRIIHDPTIENDKDDVDGDSNDFEVKLVDSDGEEEIFFISTNSNNSQEISEQEAEKNADWAFFESLLPDVQKMNAGQKSKFRNALLMSIDVALYGEEDF